jgi:molybdopterin molybdotransferase
MEDGRVAPVPTQDSAQIARLAQADVLIVREAHAPAIESGASVEIIDLDMFSDVA